MGKSRIGAALALCVLLLSGCGEGSGAAEMPVTTAAPVETTQPETVPAFAPETQPEETEPTQGQRRYLLTFAGDCTLGSSAATAYAQLGFLKTVGEDYDYPFRNVQDYFAQDDFTLVNLEGPLCEVGNPAAKTFVFRGPTAYTAILTQGGVEAVSLANNHSLDYGQAGYDATREALDAAGIPYVERDSSVVIPLEDGTTAGVYGAVYYLLDTQQIARDIAQLAEQADIVIFAPHWGVEGSYHPTPAQTELAHAAIDAGADIVFGTHPHVLQPVEAYNGGVIFYSLGNFSFGGNPAPEDMDTALIQQEVLLDEAGNVTLGDRTLVPASVSSVEGHNNFQPTPYPADSEDYQRVLAKLDGSFSGPNLALSGG